MPLPDREEPLLPAPAGAEPRPGPALGALALLRQNALRGEGASCAAVLLLALAMALPLVVTPLAIKVLFDRVIGQHDTHILIALILGLAAVYLGLVVADLLAAYLCTGLAGRFATRVRERMYRLLLAVPVDFFTHTRAGDIISRFTGDLAAAERLVFIAPHKIAPQLFSLLLCVAGLLWIEYRLVAVTLLAVPLPTLLLRGLGGRATSAVYLARGEASKLSGAVQDAMAGHQVLRAFSLQHVLLRRFRDMQQAVQASARAAGMLNARVEQLQYLGIMVGQLVIIGLGGYLVVRGRMTVGALSGFLALGFNASGAAAMLASFVPDVLQAQGGMRRIAELLAVPVKEELDEPPPLFLATELRFTNVSYSYAGSSRPALRGVSLTIRRGQSVAFVGRSGSGKSTLLNLLLRFAEANAGQITVDGRDMCTIATAAWRAGIGCVFQNTYLFPLSVRENIRQGRLDASDEAVVAAARAAEVHDAICELPEGYDTVLGETGGLLSGGQQQRLAIARAIVRNPQVLLLDEATSALDPTTEAQIEATLDRLAAGRTRIVVTHRLATAAHADWICVLEHGELVQQGTHAELVARPGVYETMWRRQSALVVEASGTMARLHSVFLRTVPLFVGLRDDQLDQLALRFVSEVHKADTTILEEGEPGDKLYVLVRGRLRVSSRSKSLRDAVLEEGDIFGEMALLSGEPRNATVRTSQQSLLLSLSRAQFEECLNTIAGFRAEFEKMAAERSRKFNGS